MEERCEMWSTTALRRPSLVRFDPCIECLKRPKHGNHLYVSWLLLQEH
jgi:hypothetical protein